ncbi:SusC/RagA family TonB-linked outer membrane protein [Panacibacter sp. DH6]|uniref:SusC/RagA family TonB-linked outer membrane protein n=2 Tax=Panacibacter microcysteis TaxID=2793269 RepID=A0A931H0E5_9BACT|nr:SusC/RagA family TonB-linked outer membrane protein [Panacibacter microcysteis]
MILFVSFFLLLHASAQSMQLKGRITDATTKQAVASATVENTNTKKSVLTDNDGNFSIAVNKGDVLTVIFIGYQSKSVTVQDESFITIEIAATDNQLNDVVVTALGVKKETKRLGYSIQEVKGEDLIKARDQNPITGLTGKVAGLSVGASAEMLRKPTVILRGNEITLYVVDGVPVSSDTWNISPDDIETYTVLKGPAAAALYGSRAQYGAILITTKKGLKRKGFTVELNSTNSMDKGFLAFPRLQDEYGPGENQMYAFGNGKGGGLFDNDYDVWGPRFDGRLLPQYDGKYDPNTTYTTTFPGGYQYTGNIEPTPWVARGKNNLDNFLRTGFQTTNNVALSATGDNYNLRFSLSHSYQQSMIPNMELNITNFNMYGSYNVSKRLKIDANLNFNKQYTPNYPDVDYGPNSLIYNVAIWTGADWDVTAPDIKGMWQAGKVGTQSVFAEYQRYHNPWFMVNEWLRGHYKSDIYGYVSGNYKIDDHLNVNLRTQISTYNLLRTEKMPFSAHPYGREGNMGDYREDRRDLFENNTDLQLNYNYTVANFLNLSGLVGGNARLFSYNSNWASTDYLNIPNVYSFSNSLNPIQASSFNADMRVYSAYYSLDASLGKYATISVTGRVDKSSALPKGNNSYFYPSVSVSSVISDYVKMPEVISFLKVRGSYAAVHGDATSATVGTAPFNSITAFGTSPSGNSLYDYPLDYGNNYTSPYGGPDYSLVALYNTSKPYNNQTAAYYTGNLYDPNIKTFNRVSYEGGVDMKFLKNRLGLSGTYFQYVDGPRILQNPISSSTGYSYYYLNALTTKKTGYEISLTGTPVKTKNFTWNTLINWSTYQDKYAELPPGQTTYNTFFREGDRVDAFYSSAFVKTADGQIIFDQAGKPLVNPVSQFLGYLNADFSWSFYNSVSWKNLSVGFQFDGRVGGVTTDYMHNKTMRGGRNIETIQGAFGAARLSDDNNAGNPDYLGIYVGEGVTVSNNTAINFDSETGEILNYKDLQFAPNSQVSLVQDYISKYYNVSEANLMSKTYAKLREVTITYNFPQQWLQKSFISRLSVSLVGRNLLYFYKDKRFKDVDLDQYNYSTGGTDLQSPTMRRYGLNINVVF